MHIVVAVVSLSVVCGTQAAAMPISHAARLAGILPGYAVVCDGESAFVAEAFPAGSAQMSDAEPVDGGPFPDSQFAPSAESSAAAAHSTDAQSSPRTAPDPKVPIDANGDPIPLERQQPKRILGFMPNFRSVSSGAKPHPLGWKYNFSVATHQATDYSSFIFLGLTSLTAEGMNMHAALGKGVGGFYAYSWRGFLDKSDNTYLSAWLLPSALHEDTRFYALGNEHSIPVRTLYVISRQGVAKTYGGRQTPNIAGLGGKALAQVFSRFYYPPSATSFAVLASKFGYSVMRDVIFSSIREFYPDAAAHFVRKHQKKMAAKAASPDAAVQ